MGTCAKLTDAVTTPVIVCSAVIGSVYHTGLVIVTTGAAEEASASMSVVCCAQVGREASAPQSRPRGRRGAGRGSALL